MKPRTGRDLKALFIREPRLTLAVAESVTCGQVQARIGEISGASGFFIGGLTAYTLDQKVRHLGVDRRAAKAVNSVSPEVAREMAWGASELFGSDLAVATTGYAEPSKEWRVSSPMAHWALVHRRRGRIVSESCGLVVGAGLGRIEMQAAVTDVVLAELLAYLRTLRG